MIIVTVIFIHREKWDSSHSRVLIRRIFLVSIRNRIVEIYIYIFQLDTFVFKHDSIRWNRNVLKRVIYWIDIFLKLRNKRSKCFYCKKEKKRNEAQNVYIEK